MQGPFQKHNQILARRDKLMMCLDGGFTRGVEGLLFVFKLLGVFKHTLNQYY